MLKLLMEVCRTPREGDDVFIIDQEAVAPFEEVKNLTGRIGFKLEVERCLYQYTITAELPKP